MKKTCLLFTIIFNTVLSQTVEEPLEGIAALREEITQSKALVEQRISVLKESDPVFAPQDPFESNSEYVSRMVKASDLISDLRSQYVDSLMIQLGELRGQLFETQNLTVIADPERYNANNEVWTMTVEHRDYQQDKIEIKIKLPRAQARQLHQNWKHVQKVGFLGIDIGDKVGLFSLHLKDPETGWEYVENFELMARFPRSAAVKSVAFSQDGKFLATGASDGLVEVLNLETGPGFVEYGHSDRVNSVAFSPDGRFFATGSSDDSARIYHVGQGNLIRVLHHPNDVNEIVFSPNSSFISTASADSMIRTFDLETGGEVSSIQHSASVKTVAFSPDGKMIASGSSDYFVRVFDTKTGEEITSIEHGGSINSVAFSQNGEYLASGSDDHTATVLNVETGSGIRSFRYEGAIPQVAFSADGRLLAMACIGFDRYGSIEEGHALVFSLETGRELQSFKQGNGVYRVSFSSDSRLLAMGVGDYTTRVFDIEEGNEVVSFQDTSFVASIAFSPDGKSLATGSSDEKAFVYDLETYPGFFSFQIDEEVNSVVFSPDGRNLAIGSDDNHARIYSLESGEEVQSFEHNGSVESVTFSPDGKFVATGYNTARRSRGGYYNYRARILDVETGHTVYESQDIYHDIPSVSFSPDGKLVAIAPGPTESDATRMWLYNVETGEELWHGGYERSLLTSVSFSPDGRFVATGSSDGTWLYNIESRNLRSLTHEDYVNSVAFSPDGKFLATGGENGGINIFDVSKSLSHVTAGLLVRAVASGSFAERIPIIPGDVLVSFADYSVVTAYDLDQAERSTNPDFLYDLKIFRDEEYITTQVKGGSELLRGIVVKTIRRGIAPKKKKSFQLESSVNALAFSPDGAYLAGGCSDKNVYLFRTLLLAEE